MAKLSAKMYKADQWGRYLPIIRPRSDAMIFPAQFQQPSLKKFPW